MDAEDAGVEEEMTGVIECALAAPYPDPALPATAYKPERAAVPARGGC